MITNTIKINIRDNCVSESEAMTMVRNIMSGGRISNNGKSYCYCTKYKDSTVVFSNKKKYDIFDIFNEKAAQP